MLHCRFEKTRDKHGGNIRKIEITAVKPWKRKFDKKSLEVTELLKNTDIEKRYIKKWEKYKRIELSNVDFQLTRWSFLRIFEKFKLFRLKTFKKHINKLYLKKTLRPVQRSSAKLNEQVPVIDWEGKAAVEASNNLKKAHTISGAFLNNSVFL